MANLQTDPPSKTLKQMLDEANEEALAQKQTTPSTLSPHEATEIDAMPLEKLRELCKRMARQCGLVAAMSEEETAQAMLDTLAHTALKPIIAGLNMRADIDSRLKAVDKWLDRTQGKAIQRIDQRVLHAHKGMAGDMSSGELMALLREVKQLPDGVRLLENGTLDIVDVEQVVTVDQ